MHFDDAPSAMIDPQEHELELLRSDPRKLILEYQDMISRIVGKYVRSRMFHPDFFPDAVQTINAELLVRIPSMQLNYNGSAMVRTYVSAIIRNICRNMHETGQFVHLSNHSLEENTSDPIEVQDRFSIEQSTTVFRALLAQYDDRLPRLIFFLKLRFRIPLTREDVLLSYPRCSQFVVERLVARFGKEYRSMKDREIYAFLTPLLNKILNRNNTADALRKWILVQLEEISETMNASIPGAAFDEEALGILIENYFSPFLLKE